MIFQVHQLCGQTKFIINVVDVDERVVQYQVIPTVIVVQELPNLIRSIGIDLVVVFQGGVGLDLIAIGVIFYLFHQLWMMRVVEGPDLDDPVVSVQAIGLKAVTADSRGIGRWAPDVIALIHQQGVEDIIFTRISVFMPEYRTKFLYKSEHVVRQSAETVIPVILIEIARCILMACRQHRDRVALCVVSEVKSVRGTKYIGDIEFCYPAE